MNLKNNFFSTKECEIIHKQSVKVLGEMGVEFNDEYALEVFKNAGATVEGKVVKIPQNIIDEALKTVPAEFKIYGRNGKEVTIGGDNQIIAPESGALNILTENGMEKRTPEHFKKFMKLHHNSRVMDMINPSLFEPIEIDQKIVRDYQMAVCLKYSDKPMLGLATSKQDSEHSIDMCQRFIGREENVCLGIISVISPVKYDEAMLQSMRVFVERKQPVMVACCSQPGATSPVSMFGTFIIDNAQVLAGVVYSQLLRKGAEVMYGNTSGSCDHRYVAPAIGAPETGFSIFMAAAMAKYYNMPCRTGGSLADAKEVDWQCGVEAILTTLPTVMSSSNYVLHSCGVMDSFNVLSYAKYVLDEQNIEMCRFMVNGVNLELDEDDLEEEIENIMDVGVGGNYIEEIHTMTKLRQELYTPMLFNKMGYSSWKHAGEKTVTSHAFAEVEKRVEAYEFPEMSKEQEDVLRSYIGDLVDTI